MFYIDTNHLITMQDQLLKSNIFNLVNVDAKKVLDSIQEDECAKNEEGGPKKRKKLEDFTPQERMIRRCALFSQETK